MLLQGVELGTITAPFHTICLKSELVSGSVTVGLRPSLPVKGVLLILRNNLAGGKVSANLCVSEIPCNKAAVGNIEQIPDLYPPCAVTRHQSHYNT